MPALLISLKVACWVTVLVLPPGILLGFLLARGDFRGKSLIETTASLPLREVSLQAFRRSRNFCRRTARSAS